MLKIGVIFESEWNDNYYYEIIEVQNLILKVKTISKLSGEPDGIHIPIEIEAYRRNVINGRYRTVNNKVIKVLYG